MSTNRSEAISITYTAHNEKHRTYVFFLKIPSPQCMLAAATQCVAVRRTGVEGGVALWTATLTHEKSARHVAFGVEVILERVGGPPDVDARVLPTM